MAEPLCSSEDLSPRETEEGRRTCGSEGEGGAFQRCQNCDLCGFQLSLEVRMTH